MNTLIGEYTPAVPELIEVSSAIAGDLSELVVNTPPGPIKAGKRHPLHHKRYLVNRSGYYFWSMGVWVKYEFMR